MNKIFAGLIFIFLYFNIKIGGSVIDLLPDFVGYLLILAGFLELHKSETAFAKNLYYLIGFTLYEIYIYGISFFVGRVPFLPSLLAILFQLYTMYFIYQAIRDCEVYIEELHAKSLKKSWICCIIMMPFLCVTLYLNQSLLFAIGSILLFFFEIWYLIAFYQSKKRYQQRLFLLKTEPEHTILDKETGEETIQ